MLALTVDEARRRASALVDREEYRVRSRMLAYENVGQLIGKSGMWVRRFVNGYADVTPSFPVGMSIISLYENICLRIERDTDRRNANAALDRLVEKPARETARVPTPEGDAQSLARDDRKGPINALRS